MGDLIRLTRKQPKDAKMIRFIVSLLDDDDGISDFSFILLQAIPCITHTVWYNKLYSQIDGTDGRVYLKKNWRHNLTSQELEELFGVKI